MKIMKSQQGMSLVELMMTVAITGVIVAFLGTAIWQMSSVTAYGNDRLTALHELQNAARWFNLDGQRATDASTGPDTLTLTGTPPVTYTLVGTELRRTAGVTPLVVAHNITSVSFAVNGRVVTMSLTSAPEGQYGVSQTGTYLVNLRPAEAD
jgi:prepilin-type N-terminal cleavage/methylation domain-containing protein